VNVWRRWWSSLRFRLVVASIVWTFGLLYVTHLGTVLVFFGPDPMFGRFGRLSLMLVVAVALMVIGVLIVRRSMATLAELRRRLSAVRHGRERAVSGVYPTEIQPLVDDLNQLLDHQERRVREALVKAGDLAHGVKTPLAVLIHEAERAHEAGHKELAAVLTLQTDRMRRHVEYHLAHARAAASGAVPGARCSVAESVSAIVRTLHRLHASRGLSIGVDVSESQFVRAQREDLDEILGNLLDNACKWASSRVAVSSIQQDGHVSLNVDDDGPGIAAAMRDAVLQRGVRADEAAPGRGFGLAIVSEVIDLYQGSMTLESSPLGGLRVRVTLPRAQTQIN
jgi:signal transduction histidine kinase